MAHFEEEIEITADASSLERAGEESNLVLDRLRRKLDETNAEIAKTGERTPGLDRLQNKLKSAIHALEEYDIAAASGTASTDELSDKAKKAAAKVEDLRRNITYLGMETDGALVPALEAAAGALDRVADEADHAGDELDRAGDKAEAAAAKFSLLAAIGGMGGMLPLLGLLGGGAPLGMAAGGGLLGAGGGLLGVLGGGAAGLGGLGVSGIGLGLIIQQALKLALNTSGSATFGGMKFKIPTAPVAGLADALKELQAAIGPILVALRGLGGGVIGALVKGAHAILPQISKELVGFIHDITPLAEHLATSLLGLASKIVPLVLHVMTVFTPQLLRAINQLAPAVLGLFRALIPLGEVFNSALGKALFHLVGSLTQFFKVNRDELSTFIRELFRFLSLLGDQLLSLLQATLPLGGTLLQGISDFLTTFLGGLTRFLIRNAPELKTALKGIFTFLIGLVPILFQLLQGLMPLARPILQIAMSAIPLLRAILPIIPSAVALLVALTPWVIAFLNALTWLVKEIRRPVTDLLGGLAHGAGNITAFARRIPGFIAAIGHAFGNVGHAAGNVLRAIGGAQEAVHRFLAAISNWITGRLQTALGVLKGVADVGAGVVQGVVGAVAAFVDAVNRVIGDIVGFFSGIHIPHSIHIPGTPITIPVWAAGAILTSGPTFHRGGLVGEGTAPSFGARGRGDEAVIPLNSQGVDVLAQALGKALRRSRVDTGGRSGSRVLQLHIPWEQIRRGVITIVDDEVGFRVGA